MYVVRNPGCGIPKPIVSTWFEVRIEGKFLYIEGLKLKKMDRTEAERRERPARLFVFAAPDVGVAGGHPPYIDFDFLRTLRTAARRFFCAAAIRLRASAPILRLRDLESTSGLAIGAAPFASSGF